MKDNSKPYNFHSDVNLPKGIHRIRSLPEATLGTLWDSIILDEKIKQQLLSQAVVNFTVRDKVDRSARQVSILIYDEDEKDLSSLSPYNSMGNDPVRYSDPKGDILGIDNFDWCCSWCCC